MALYPALVAILLAGEAHRPVREAGARFHDTARATAVLDERDAVLASSSVALERSVSAGRARVAVRDLVVRHPGRAAATPSLARLDGAGGELLVVAGPSGVGKTTLLRALAGTLDDAASAVGEVDVRGHLVVLGQHPQLPHAATVGEALGDGSPALLRRLGLDLDLGGPARRGRALAVLGPAAPTRPRPGARRGPGRPGADGPPARRAHGAPRRRERAGRRRRAPRAGRGGRARARRRPPRRPAPRRRPRGRPRPGPGSCCSERAVRCF